MMNSTISVAKTKALISCAVTAQLICVFVFAYADYLFSHASAHFIVRRRRKYFVHTDDVNFVEFNCCCVNFNEFYSQIFLCFTFFTLLFLNPNLNLSAT